jgi:hypothetical protein
VNNVQANGQAPVERLTDRFAEEMLRPLVEREVARQLAPPAKHRWTLADYLNVAYTLAWWAALVSVGFVIGNLR